MSPSLAFISAHDTAGNSGMEPSGTEMKKDWILLDQVLRPEFFYRLGPGGPKKTKNGPEHELMASYDARIR